jgi:hypothetical protein
MVCRAQDRRREAVTRPPDESWNAIVFVAAPLRIVRNENVVDED